MLRCLSPSLDSVSNSRLVVRRMRISRTFALLFASCQGLCDLSGRERFQP